MRAAAETNAVLILGAIIEMSDHAKRMGGSTCISGIAALHTMQTSIQKNRGRVIAMLQNQASLSPPSAPHGDTPAEANNTGGDAGASQEGPDDDQRGEALSLEQALDEISAAKDVPAVNRLVAAHKVALPDHEDAIMAAGGDRSEALLREKM